MWRVGLIVLTFACSMSAACIDVIGQDLLASDLAKADPAFASLDPGIVFSYAPALGASKFVSGAELEQWAAKHGLQVKPVSACFARATQLLEPADVAAAVVKAITPDLENLQVDVVEVCPCKLPNGQLQFVSDGASTPTVTHPEAPVFWRGQLIDAQGRSYPVWARVRALASIPVVRAAKGLRQQHIVTREDLELTRIQASPLGLSPAAGIQGYVGKVMKMSLAQGAILKPDFVRTPYEVERGSLVSVDVVNGAAFLALKARAETAGNTGQMVTLMNPAGAARFQALVTGPGHAEVVLSALQADRSDLLSEKREPQAGTVGARSF